MGWNRDWQRLKEEWGLMGFYERFEQLVALVLTLLISVVILFALFSLGERVFVLLIAGGLDPVAPESFTTLFGMIMTVLIAMEFKHSILRVVARKESIIQVRTVLLIAMLAISRKFIILDVQATGAGSIAALAASLLALGVVYWLVRNSDRADARWSSERQARGEEP